MAYVLGSRSKQRLIGVHPRLVAVVERAIQISKVDFTVLEGVRSYERQRELYGQGRTKAECVAAGVPERYAQPKMQKVTWTLVSNHFKKPSGFGHAVDLAPFPIDWEGPVKFPKFDAIADAMFAAAKEKGERIRWGADWDMDGKPRERGETDSPHFEIVL